MEGNLKQQLTTKSPDNISSDAQYTQHWGLAIDNQNNLLVGEINHKYISKHQLNGKHINSFKVSIHPWYIAVSPRDKIIVSDRNKGVHVLDKGGVHLYSLKPPHGSSWFPYGMCCTADDTVYIADCSTGEIHCYSSKTGAYIGCVTKDVSNPKGLALMDDEEKLVVVQEEEVKIFQRQ